MRCRAALLIALLASSAALADPPADAPVAIDVHKGDPAPADGVFLPNALALAKAAKCRQAEQDRDRYRQMVVDEPAPAGSMLLAVGVVGLVVGAVVGGFVVALAKK